MGKILQIRVSAVTYNPDDIKKFYPTLFKLAWPEKDRYIPASQRYGLLELIQTLADAAQFARWPKEWAAILQPIQELTEKSKQLEDLILAWQPKEADQITYQLEDNLAALEALAKSLKIPN